LYGGNSYFGQACSISAGAANEVNMIVVMMTFAAIILAQRVQYRIICCRDIVNDAFFEKGMQGAIYSNAIES
jgi:hypothetical protein